VSILPLILLFTIYLSDRFWNEKASVTIGRTNDML
jgi:hypothetical protein